jgi:hypothetical protein
MNKKLVVTGSPVWESDRSDHTQANKEPTTRVQA